MTREIIHVCNRGVDKRLIFQDGADYYRFVRSLYVLNNKNGSLRTERNNDFYKIKQEPLVDILKWSLLPNHYHLLLRERVENGTVEFIKRLGNSYTKYFNIRNSRKGYLFQNSAKIIPVNTLRHYLYVPLYIDLNPLKNLNLPFNKAWGFIKNYKWASAGDYLGNKQYPYIINKQLFYELYETTEKIYEKEILAWLKDSSTCQVDDLDIW